MKKRRIEADDPRSLEENELKQALLKNLSLNVCQRSVFFDKTLIRRELTKMIFLGLSEGSPAWNQRMDFEKSFVNELFLIIGPRRFGKTTILHFLEVFFSGLIPKDLLKKLKIPNSDVMPWYGKYCTAL